MKSKEKNRKITILIILIILVWSSALLIWFMNNNKKIVYASNEEEVGNVKISNATQIDIDSIIQKNTKKDTKEEIVIEEVELEYITKYRDNNDILKGETKISQEGRKGIQHIITKKIYDDQGNLVDEKQLSATVVKASINQIIEVGTATKAELAAKKARVSGGSANLNFDMALNTPSGFSLEQFKLALTDSEDKNKTFEDNAEYFYYIESQYSINGMFVAAVGIHESAWGTSKIAINKKNLFGYGAYDSNPYNGAYKFETYSESIDLIARVFVKYYLNPAKTPIYGDEVASGAYYSGNTLSAVNKRYATDKNWAKSVYKHMQYLYGKL